MIDLLILTLILIVPPLVGLGITIITTEKEPDEKSTEASTGNHIDVPVTGTASIRDRGQDGTYRRGDSPLLPRAICWKDVCMEGHSRGLRWMRVCV